MPTFSIDYTTDAERLQYETMIAYVQEMARLGASAAPGTVLDTCERFAWDRGRQVIRGQLEATVQACVDAQKKSPANAARDPSRGRW